MASHTLKKWTGRDLDESKLLLWEKQADAVVQELTQLKGAAMKVGQMVAVIGDRFFPPSVVQKFSELQADSIKLEWPEVERCLVRRMGRELLSELEVEEKAFAAASIGQVHKAVIKSTGEVICLKIQYPGIDSAIDSDIKAVRRLIGLFKMLPVDSQELDDILKEIKMMMKREMDYRKELDNTNLFREALMDMPNVKVPKTYPRYSSKKILATEFCQGVSLDDISITELPDEKRQAVAQTIVNLHFRECFDLHLLQTDPHFGNFKLDVSDDGFKLVLLDFGAWKKLTNDFVASTLELIEGVWRNCDETIESGLTGLGYFYEDDSREIIDSFIDLVKAVFSFYLKEGHPYYDARVFDYQGRVNFAESQIDDIIKEKTASIAIKTKFRSPPRDMVYFGRKSIGLLGIVTRLNVGVDLHSFTRQQFGDQG